jgi:outer membrane protein assembly factor BamB
LRQVLFLATSIVPTFAATCGTSTTEAADWTRFRGDNGTGVVNLRGLPTTWSPGDYDFNIEIPGVGHSSPVISGDTLFVTSAIEEGAVRALYCIDANTGETRWSKVVGMNRSKKHNKSSWASSTPTTDGEAVYVVFADKERQTVSAWDFEGTLLWRRVIGPFTSQHGQGVSPILYKDLVILPNDQMGPSFVIALDKQTGKTRWCTLRTHRRTSYATPMIIELPGEEPQLICVSGAMGVTSLDPETGRMNWMTGELQSRTVASPVFTGKYIIASCGGGGIGHEMIAVDPSEPGRAGKERIVWTRDKLLPYVPTPIAQKDHLYLWSDKGFVVCLSAETGEEVARRRLGKVYSGSPVCINDHLYCMNESGDVEVVTATPELKNVATIPLGDPSHATPAVANDRLYLRTFHRLMALKTAP